MNIINGAKNEDRVSYLSFVLGLRGISRSLVKLLEVDYDQVPLNLTERVIVWIYRWL